MVGMTSEQLTTVVCDQRSAAHPASRAAIQSVSVIMKGGGGGGAGASAQCRRQRQLGTLRTEAGEGALQP